MGNPTGNASVEQRDIEAPGYRYERDPSVPQFRPIGNPSPLGFFCFGLPTFLLSLITLGAADVSTPNIVIGLAFAYGGIALFVAGMWDFACGNTFGACALTSYAGFWLSYSIIYIPSFNIAPAYLTHAPGEFYSAVGHYLISWFIFTMLMTVATIRTNIALFGLLMSAAMTFLMLAISYYLDLHKGFQKAGGSFGIITAAFCFYNAVAALWTPSNSWIRLPLGTFPWAPKPEKEE